MYIAQLFGSPNGLPSVYKSCTTHGIKIQLTFVFWVLNNPALYGHREFAFALYFLCVLAKKRGVNVCSHNPYGSNSSIAKHWFTISLPYIYCHCPCSSVCPSSNSGQTTALFSTATRTQFLEVQISLWLALL